MPAPRALLVTALVGLVVAAALGIWLRLALAGHAPLVGEFASLRHAHTHAGYYVVLFPLAWLVWHRLGARAPGPRLSALYGVAGLASIAAFAWQGYALASIVGSTVVGAVWLVSAARARGTTEGWLRVVPVGIALAACFVPPIGVLSSRRPELAQELVQSFLTVLLLLVMVPTALATLRLPAPPPALWVALTGIAAAFLGPLPLGPLGISLSVLGVLLAAAGFRRPAPAGLRLAWLGVALGLVLVGLQGAPPAPHRAIAAIHALVLGPLCFTLAPAGRVATAIGLVAAAGMGAAIAAVELGLSPVRSNLWAATAGLVWLPAAALGVGKLFSSRAASAAPR